MTETLHVVPIDDLIEHQTDGDECICGPDCELVQRDDAPDMYLYSHHSLDGREIHETA